MAVKLLHDKMLWLQVSVGMKVERSLSLPACTAIRRERTGGSIEVHGFRSTSGSKLRRRSDVGVQSLVGLGCVETHFPTWVQYEFLEDLPRLISDLQEASWSDVQTT